MEKEKIYSTLLQKVGQTSLSERTINAYIEKFMPNEGEPDESWFNTHSEVLKTLSGNLSHDVAAQVNQFKASYKPQPTEPPTKPTEPPVVPPSNPEVDELKKQIAELTNAFKARNEQAVADEIRQSVIGKGEALKANLALWKMAASQVAIDSSSNAESAFELTKAKYESMQKDVFGNSSAPYGASAKSIEEQSTEDIDAFFKSKGEIWAK